MEVKTDNLNKVSSPALIIHSKNDPVINPESGPIITSKINSKIKKLVELDLDKHVIVTGKDNKKVFDEIGLFLEKLMFNVETNNKQN